VSAVPIENLKNCAKEDHEVVMLAGREGAVGGAATVDREVEVYDPESKRSCYLPPLPESRYRNSNLGLLVCGGVPAGQALSPFPVPTDFKDCIRYDTKTGIWNTNSLVTLTNVFVDGSIWNSTSGPVLFGGDGVTQLPAVSQTVPAVPQTLTELLRSDGFGGLSRSANLTYVFRRGTCGITESGTKTFILTGGRLADQTTYVPLVERYSFPNLKKDFPPLFTARAYHGCGSYTDTNGKTVFLVAGGMTSATTFTPTTEIFTQGDSSWRQVAPLPTDVYQTGSASLNNKVYLFGNARNTLTNEQQMIYTWDGAKWVADLGTDLKETRVLPGVSVVRLSEGIMNHCNALELP